VSIRGIGDLAPEIRLTDLDGEPRSLAAMRGDKTLVLFWNPECGFCQQMLPDLQAWEAGRTASDPRLFLVSGGSVEANRRLNLRSPIVLDPTFSTGSAFGATGTPSGVLVDAKGLVASSVASGAQAVFALIGAPGPQPRR
jgi:peroxiredoxin